MSLLRNLASGMRSLFRKEEVDRELEEELRAYQEIAAEEKMKDGLSRKEALRAVRLELGSVDSVKEVVRSGGWEFFLETCWQDLRFGLRVLRKFPGFTIVAVLTLTLGIGANTAIFSVVNSLVIRPLPVNSPHEVVSLASQAHVGTGSSNGFSYPDFSDIRNQTSSVFRDLAGIEPFHMDGFSVDGNSQSIWVSYVTTNFFQVMGIRPALGTFFQPSNGKINGSEPLLVLSYSFWKTHLAEDASVIGKSVSINAHPVTIVGVAPRGFGGVVRIADVQGYLPIGMASVSLDSPGDFLTNRSQGNVEIVGRLRPGVTVGQAQPILAVVARRLSGQYPEIHKWEWLQAFPGGPLDTDRSGKAVVDSMAAFFLLLVGLVLVLGCMNVANLLLVRASGREREMAVRSALGASRGRLVRQLLTESLLLASFGCAGGVVLGVAASRSLNSVNFASALPIAFNVSLDWRVLAYAVGAALLTGPLVGLTPALRAARDNLSNLPHEAARTGTVRRQRARSILVVAELSGSLMLLIVAGLFVRSLQFVERTDLGFDPSRVVNLTVSPAEGGYNEVRARQFLKQLLEQVRTLPGVESASLAATIPMGYYNYGDEIEIEGYETARGQQQPFASYNAVSPGYLGTMHMSLIRGRDFRDSDDETSQNVAIINEEMASRYWANRDPIGMHFTIPKEPSHSIEVVGIVKNSRTQHLTGPFHPYFYRPFAQHYLAPVALQLRTNLPSALAFRQAIDLVHTMSPAMPVFDVQTMTQALDTLNGLLLYQAGAVLTASLGILGLSLGIVGVYGVVSYAASQRTHEIGVRMALGASSWQVLRMIFGQGLALSGAGIVAGAALAAVVGRLASSLLSGVSAVDPVTYMSASGLLASIALLACYIPARRAMRVDPMLALRYE